MEIENGLVAIERITETIRSNASTHGWTTRHKNCSRIDELRGYSHFDFQVYKMGPFKAKSCIDRQTAETGVAHPIGAKT